MATTDRPVMAVHNRAARRQDLAPVTEKAHQVPALQPVPVARKARSVQAIRLPEMMQVGSF